jgi:hypothetical protein
MYVFVLEWTPALTQALNKSAINKTDSKNPPIPHGINDVCFFTRDSLIKFLFRICFC